MKKQRFILDRIEENIAVLEYENGIIVTPNCLTTSVAKSAVESLIKT